VRTIAASLSVIADKWTPCEQKEGLSPIAAAGIPIWIDASARIAHEKARIIDRRVTIMGSYNFSAGAAWNSEDMNVVTSAEVAEAYAAHWRARLHPGRSLCRDKAGVSGKAADCISR
jgi:phosphatidylserine/phosphatidylglycerophosphate/cardiolipin synthase-like enzyme